MARTKNTPAKVADPMAALFAQFQAFVAESQNGATEIPATPAKVKRAPAKVKRTCNITAGEAWEALGADPEFKPANLDKSASGPMLWRLNDKGMLSALLA